jgi:5'-nucleotidase
LALLLGATATGATGDETEPFRILVCNDDGVRSEGIAALARELAKLGEVHVVAPLENRSGASHAIELLETAQVRAYPVYRNGELFGHGVTGTPVDAVLTGIYGLHSDLRFDLVVSGINFGNNVGVASMYSGTVGAALEGVIQGIPAVAVSQAWDRQDGYALAARFTAKLVERIRENGLPTGVALSINVPAGEIKGAVARPMGGSMLKGAKMESDRDYLGAPHFKVELAPADEFPPGSDTEAYSQRYITITPIRLDWTAHEVVDLLEGWNLSAD